jgi:hypothetical protein
MKRNAYVVFGYDVRNQNEKMTFDVQSKSIEEARAKIIKQKPYFVCSAVYPAYEMV